MKCHEIFAQKREKEMLEKYQQAANETNLINVNGTQIKSTYFLLFPVQVDYI